MAPSLLSSYISFLGLLVVVIAQNTFEFVYPPPLIDNHISTSNIVSMVVGTTKTIRWQTTWSRYDIALCQIYSDNSFTCVTTIFSTIANINNLPLAH